MPQPCSYLWLDLRALGLSLAKLPGGRGYRVDYPNLHLGDVAGGCIAQGLALGRGEVFGLFDRYLRRVVEAAHPEELGPVGVDPGVLHRYAQAFVQGPDVLVEQADLGVHHPAVNGVDA